MYSTIIEIPAGTVNSFIAIGDQVVWTPASTFWLLVLTAFAGVVAVSLFIKFIR